MSVNVLMLSPGFPAEMPHFTRGLADVGANVIGLGDQPEGALPELTRKHLSAYVQVGSFADDSKTKSVEEIVGNLRSAIDEYNANPTLNNDIRVATWKVMFGEIATEGGESLSLWSVALDQFDEGLKSLADIEDQIFTVPQLNEDRCVHLTGTNERSTAHKDNAHFIGLDIFGTWKPV